MLKWVATFLLIWFIYHIRAVFPPFIMGAILAYLLLPMVQQLSSWAKIRMVHATAILYLGTAVAIGVACWFFGPALLEQFQSLASNRHEIVRTTLAQAASTFGWSIDLNQQTTHIVAAIDEHVGKPSEIMHLGGLLSHGLLSVLVCVVSSIYFLIDSQRVGAFFLRFVPEKRRSTAVNLSGEMNKMLTRYVRGQLILIVVMSTVAYVYLHFIMHIKYALPIAIMSGFLEIIPVLGPILATSTATLVAFAQYGVAAAGYTILFYTLARWLEDYAIVPKVIGHAVSLHPLVVIFAVLAGEVMAGALGMLIAIPVAASIKVIVDFIYPEPSPLELAPSSPQLPEQMQGKEPDKEPASVGETT